MAGVSRATASRVINNAPGASGPLRDRVHAAVTELGYEPNEIARALASGRQRAVDVIAVTYGPGIGWLGTHPYFSRVLAGMMPVLEGVNAQLRVHAIGPETAAEAIDEIAANVTLGAVLADITPSLAARFYRRCRRVVSMVPMPSPHQFPRCRPTTSAARTLPSANSTASAAAESPPSTVRPSTRAPSTGVPATSAQCGTSD